ncbi:amino acid adenylation domain-containing protein [Archangium violaceum]|uniref:non-ribosomal peptide synthetase n=1 Tax=Archangium violaceum TaxID=83451 RepID=UPI00193B63C1|nr:non-ribosomal peptide synthetase [Archangium violaceum]QRK05993.1 amino acid adenylation domain-containing protein [Archangium violaceum]
MSIQVLLSELARRGIQLSLVEGQIDVRAPKGSLTPELRNELARSKEELLAVMRARAGGGERQLPQLVPDPAHRHEPFPLTDIQQAYWIGRSAAYDLGDVSIHLYTELDAVGLDLERLEHAWNAAIARHDMLRAVILPDGRQQILPEVPRYSFPVRDLRGRSAAEVEAELAEARERLSHQVFQADQWPTFEVSATRMDGDRTRVHVSVDLLHIDGGSLLLLNQDWIQLYLNPDKALPPLELSYRDYVLAEQALHETELYRRSMDYWRERVKALPPAPELPLAKKPGSHGSTRFTRRDGRLSPELWSRVMARCTALGLTPSAVLMAAYAEVLAAWSRNPRLTLNVTLFNRLPLHPQVNSLLGDFTSMILLGVDGSVSEPLVSRVQRLQEQLWTDLEHRYVSGVQVLRELARYNGTEAGGMPVVFTSLLSLGAQGYRPPVTSWKALGEVAFSLTQTPQVWLDNQVFEEEGALVYHWDAVEALFPPGMLDAMFAAWNELLLRLATREETWSELRAQRVLPPSEQLSAREALNATSAPIPDKSLPQLLAEQAALRPQHRAVVSSSKVLTYEELTRRAFHLGQRLASLGARTDAPVAVVMEKGWEQVVAVYAIHSAGAPYLPVDPEVPPERLRYLLQQGEVRLVLTQPQLDARLSWPEGVQRLLVEDGPVPEPVAPAALPRSNDLAYVLYTSGSTGLPKGVMIEHRSVINRILDINARFAVGPEDKALALTALHHDLSVYDLFGALAAGATLVIPDADKVKDPSHQAEWMAREGITFWNSVPAFLEMLVEHLEQAPEAPAPSALRKVILAGDWIPVTLPERLRAKVPEVRIIASGGPTETTVWDIWYEVGTVDPSWPSIPYGKPLANARYHVLNEMLEPCPVWVPGQLYIGGAGLARGYWRDAEKTRASFITHPRTGERLYKSGDLGRWLPDGNIEFLGRVDFQVKINGQRIELGEIETTLTQHPRVRNAVALVAGGEQGKKHLVAYVVADEQSKEPEKAETPAALEPAQGGGMGPSMLTDPVQRLEFKLAKRGVRKVEPGEEVVELPAPAIDESLYALRRSHREFPKPVTMEQLGRLLQSLVSIEAGGLPKYRYPSAGGLYPVRLYVSVEPGRVEGLPGGVYYHHPAQHRLVRVSGEALGQEIHAPANKTMAAQAAFTIFLVGHLAAIAPMYGPMARDFCLLEAGYMGQLLMTESASCGIGLCGLGLVDAEAVRNRLGLGADDVLVHSLVGGGVEVSSVLKPPAEEGGGAPRSLAEELRDFLRARLPGHMVPRLVLKDALPLTPNGKVDRKALLAEAVVSTVEEVYEAPTGNLEGVLAEIVQQVLGLEQVSVTRNFFDLGANSRHVVQIHGKLRQALGMDIKVTDAFRYPSIRALAAHLGQAPQGESVTQKGRNRAEARLASRSRRQG